MSDDYSLSESAADLISATLGLARMSRSELARRLGVSHTWVSYRLNGQQEIGLNDLQRIAGVLGVSAHDLLPPRPDDDDGQGPVATVTRLQPRILARGAASRRQRTGRSSYYARATERPTDSRPTGRAEQPTSPQGHSPLTQRTGRVSRRVA